MVRACAWVLLLWGCSSGQEETSSRGAAMSGPMAAKPSTAAAGQPAPIPGGNVPSAGASAAPTPSAPTAPAAKPKPSAAPPATLDPNAQFDWPETSPGQATCQPGTYVGMFACSLFVDPTMPPPAGTPPDFSGPITLVFTKSADGEFLELANAKLDGSANDTLGFMADLTGRLDCGTLEFTAMAENGVYGLGSPILLPAGDVMGTLSGKLDLQKGELTGTWSLFSGNAGKDFTCDGPWQALLTP